MPVLSPANTLVRSIALLRSLVIYHGNPLRARRLRRFYDPFVPRGGLCFDIGAHLGNRTTAWRALGARVVTVEPHPDLQRFLRLRHGRDPGVTLVGAALGARPGDATLWVSPGNLTITTLSSEWTQEVRADRGFRRLRWQRAQRIPVTTMNALIATYGIPDFTKIDVEGFEPEVLTGLDVALPCLSFEFIPAARQRALACVDRLETLATYGYNWSFGERHRLMLDTWVDAERARRFIERLALDAGSGDIYARRRGASR